MNIRYDLAYFEISCVKCGRTIGEGYYTCEYNILKCDNEYYCGDCANTWDEWKECEKCKRLLNVEKMKYCDEHDEYECVNCDCVNKTVRQLTEK